VGNSDIQKIEWDHNNPDPDPDPDSDNISKKTRDEVWFDIRIANADTTDLYVSLVNKNTIMKYFMEEKDSRPVQKILKGAKLLACNEEKYFDETNVVCGVIFKKLMDDLNIGTTSIEKHEWDDFIDFINNPTSI
tara:strand:+ start:396 stop:797 length:402 start_codon:yes stop_codon:yes gene_type:complete